MRTTNGGSFLRLALLSVALASNNNLPNRRQGKKQKPLTAKQKPLTSKQRRELPLRRAKNKAARQSRRKNRQN